MPSRPTAPAQPHDETWPHEGSDEVDSERGGSCARHPTGCDGGRRAGVCCNHRPRGRVPVDVTDATPAQSAGLAHVTTTLNFGEGEAAGTGIVITSDGLVVTNHHVVESATDIVVTVATTGKAYDAEVLGYDASRDVAALQLHDAAELTTDTTKATGVTVGDAITAVGDAGGDGGSLTAAPGTVTDLHHRISIEDEETGADVPLRGLIEVSSDIVPGDNGGALLATSWVISWEAARAGWQRPHHATAELPSHR